jgi:hypothetical protein
MSWAMWTGMVLIADHAKPLELLKEAFPETSRVVFIYDPATRPAAYGESSLKALEWEARKRGIVLEAPSPRDPDGM